MNKVALYFTLKLPHSLHGDANQKVSLHGSCCHMKHLPHKQSAATGKKTYHGENVQIGKEYSHISSLWAWIHHSQQNASSGFCGGSHHPIFCRSHYNAWLSCQHTHPYDCWCSRSHMQLHSSTFYRLASRSRQDHPGRRTSLRIEWLWFCPNMSCMKMI